MNVLIADDEPIARQILRELLDDIPGVTLAGEAASGAEALARIAALDPDIVLLDMQMPELDGLEVARRLRGTRRPAVIYVTAFDQHALQAFEAGALDYLLKPVRRDRLAAAIDKARGFIVPRPAPELKSGLKKVVGKLGAELHLIPPGEIVAFIAEDETVHIIAVQGRYRATLSMKELEARLPQPPFRLVRRGAIINTDHIRSVSPLSSKRWQLRMSNGLKAVVSKRLASAIREGGGW
ncbi:MAG: response regulator transcription factor [Acidobacteria bacterium]|nr:response regulator transcription factor [Acidobacteriota bacterium]